MPRDLYYGIYIAFVAAFFVLWSKTTGQSVAAMVRRRWLLCLGLTVMASALLVPVVLGKGATTRPDGLELVGAVLWRGVAYGLADGLLLSAFPILAVFAIFEGTRLRKRRRSERLPSERRAPRLDGDDGDVHLGYSDFRSEKVRQPVAAMSFGARRRS